MFRKRSPVLFLVLAVVLAGLVFLRPTAQGAEWREVFNPYQVLSLYIDMDPADWERVRHDQPSQSEDWIPEIAEANFRAGDELPVRVTVRRKGESDIALPEGDPQKVSLKIDINALVPGQKWRGLTKLSLENGSTAPLNEGFAWMLHRQAKPVYGYEAANAAWVKVFVNGEFKGVFVNVEQRNTQFLRNHGYYKEGATWLYKVDGSTSLESGIGHSPAYQHLCYAPFNSGPGRGGGGGGGCVQPDLETDLPQWINLRGFFTLAAVNAFTENTDSLFTHSGKNSFAVDFDPGFPRTRLYFPWDLDTTIRQGDMAITGSTTYQQTFLNHPWFGQVYEQTLRDLLAGPLSEGALLKLIDDLEAVVGPAFDEDPYVYQSGSGEAFDSLRGWVTRRVANVASQLNRPFIEGPRFNQDGGEVVAGFLLTMTAPSGAAVYYTVDGSDPRSAGGGISPEARLYSGPVTIERTLQVTARSFDGTLWSGLPVNATFNIARYATPLRISEMMYHPAGDAGAESDEYEFIELKNTGDAALDLGGFYFEGISFTFPAGTTIGGGEFIVLARNAAAFVNRYPEVVPSGIYWGKLSNGGEKIRLRNADWNTVISVEYKDDPPWPLSPDGLGYSLVLADGSRNPDDAEAWRASSAIHGSPGADDAEPSYGHGIVINEVLAHSDPPYEDAIELYNPTQKAIDISGWFLSDDFSRTNVATGYDLKKYEIPAGTIVPAEGYVVFYQQQFSGQNSRVPFGLTEFGETVYLASAANGELTGLLIGAEFGATERNVSVGRHRTTADVDFTALNVPTFGVINPGSLAEFRAGKGALNSEPKVGPVVINELMYNPAPGADEFVELLNTGTEAVDISGWKLAGTSFTFPAGTILPASGLALLVDTNILSMEQFRASHNVPVDVPIFGHLFVLENEGEAIRLEKPNVSVVEPPIVTERVRYNDKAPWPTEADGEGPSLERFSAVQYGNDPANWRTVQDGGSPGRLNSFPLGIAIARGSDWKYNVSGADLGTAWTALDYSDASWLNGDGALGYGVPELVSPIYSPLSSLSKPITTFFRKEFVIHDAPDAVGELQLMARFDDGFIVHLNGEEILRSPSMPAGTVRFDTLASGYDSVGYEPFDLSAFASRLRQGRNVLAVELHQESEESEDAVWDAALSYTVLQSSAVEMPVITPPGGEFTEAVTVAITCGTPEAQIYYTLNGAEPDPSSARYTQPFPVTSSARVKARAYKAGFNRSGIAEAQFLFVTQDRDLDGDGLPDWWETEYFGNATSGEPAVDSDNDGLSNLDEYFTGSDPGDASSSLKVVIQQSGPTSLSIHWASAPGCVYQLQRSSMLSSGPMEFAVVAEDILATPPLNSHVIPATESPSFYRVQLKGR